MQNSLKKAKNKTDSSRELCMSYLLTNMSYTTEAETPTKEDVLSDLFYTLLVTAAILFNLVQIF